MPGSEGEALQGTEKRKTLAFLNPKNFQESKEITGIKYAEITSDFALLIAFISLSKL